MVTISDLMKNKSVQRAWRFTQKWQEWIIVIGLLIVLALILSLPTMKSLKTIEVSAGETVVPLEAGKTFVNKVRMPKEKISYYISWVSPEYKHDVLELWEYKTIRLEVTDPTGHVIRTAEKPKLVKREDKTALVFAFPAFQAQEKQVYTFTVKQSGIGTVWFVLPLQDMVKDDEHVDTSLQLDAKRNWLTLILDKVYGEDLVGQDISFYHYRGTQIVKGVNPYSCVKDPHTTCIGYPSHLPGMYLFSAALVAMGAQELDQWAALWRPIMLMVWLGVGVTLLVYMFRRGQTALGIASFGFWLFNRWSLYVLKVSHTDFMGVFFLVLAVIFAGRWPMFAAFLLGTSLAVKQVAVLIVPLFLLVVWRSGKFNIPKMIALTGMVVLVPLLTSIPFLMNDADATIAGWFNTATRPAQTELHGAQSIDQWLDVTDWHKASLLVFLSLVVYVAAWRRSVGMITGTLMLMAIVIAFTPVLFNQYFVWLMPFIPLAVAYAKDSPEDDALA